MKFATVLAFVALSTISNAEECRTKTTQISFLKGLIGQWTLYKKQVAANGDIDVSRAAQAAVGQSRQDAVTAEFAEKAANLSLSIASQQEANVATATALADQLASEASSRTSNIEADRATKVTAAQAKGDQQVTRLNKVITKAQNSRLKAQAKNDLKKTKAANKHTAKEAKFSAQNGAALTAALELKTEKTANATLIHEQKTAAVAANLESQLAELQARFDAEVAALNANKYDAAATLASLDNAGTTGLEYPADCLLTVEQVLPLIKGGASALETWKALINA